MTSIRIVCSERRKTGFWTTIGNGSFRSSISATLWQLIRTICGKVCCVGSNMPCTQFQQESEINALPESHSLVQFDGAAGICLVPIWYEQNIYFRCENKFWFKKWTDTWKVGRFFCMDIKMQILADCGLLIFLDVKSTRLLACSASRSLMRSETLLRTIAALP